LVARRPSPVPCPPHPITATLGRSFGESLRVTDALEK
jgi:hypothetical protein